MRQTHPVAQVTSKYNEIDMFRKMDGSAAVCALIRSITATLSQQISENPYILRNNNTHSYSKNTENFSHELSAC